ncbi:hypothetical protein WMY93_008644 [Mugilogobius chulae]|uniref:G-protein coupled receptors family 1 profile domain-containing protein n=1 Tax=Mugilogobius chulae TaxID=88201 RepID=A0AAW0PN10_9GOBI
MSGKRHGLIQSERGKVREASQRRKLRIGATVLIGANPLQLDCFNLECLLLPSSLQELMQQSLLCKNGGFDEELVDQAACGRAGAQTEVHCFSCDNTVLSSQSSVGWGYDGVTLDLPLCPPFSQFSAIATETWSRISPQSKMGSISYQSVTPPNFRHLRSKVTNFFVISLAISDLLVAILVMPWKAATEIVGFWPFGAFCNVWVAFDIMCSTASILNLCVISVDRYWAISSPFRYERKMTPKVACLMISVAWTLSVLISFIPVQLNWHKAQTTSYLDLNGSYPSELPPDNCDSSLNRTYAISSSLISFYIPVAIMIVTYTRIYRIAQKQIRRISALERAAESAKNRHSSMGNNSSMESESSFKMSFKRETKVLKTLSVIMGYLCAAGCPSLS